MSAVAEISAARRAALIDKYRDINVDHDWWDYLIDEFVQDMEKVGVRVSTNRHTTTRGRVVEEPSVYFELHCQGAGVGFAGHVHDWKLLLPALGYADTALADYADSQWVCRWGGRNNHIAYLDCDLYIDECLGPDHDARLDEQPFTHAIWWARMQQFASVDFEKEIKEFLDAKCHELYKSLDAEYDYLTEDDAVWDTIVANELHLDEAEDDETT